MNNKCPFFSSVVSPYRGILRHIAVSSFSCSYYDWWENQLVRVAPAVKTMDDVDSEVEVSRA
jgi:hypothetical protein